LNEINTDRTRKEKQVGCGLAEDEKKVPIGSGAEERPLVPYYLEKSENAGGNGGFPQ